MENLDINSQPIEKDNKKIRQCPYCKQEIKIDIGIKNWKNLFRWPTIEELITLFIIICVISIYFVYQHDIKQYQTYIFKNCNTGLSKGFNDKINTSQLGVNESLINLNKTANNTAFKV